MSSQEATIELRPDDPLWMQQQLDQKADQALVVLRPIDDDFDTEGHTAGTVLRVQAFGDEDDTEGHAISVQFPSREEAAAFRRRLVLAGALTGTLVLGAAGGYGLANVVGGMADGSGASVTDAGSGSTNSSVDAGSARSGATGDGVRTGPDAPARGTTPIPE